MALLFEWDEKKARANKKKHGITFELAATIFSDPNAITIFDNSSSSTEDRYVTIGLTPVGPLVIVCHTDRRNRIRINSARKASLRERKQYEEGI